MKNKDQYIREIEIDGIKIAVDMRTVNKNRVVDKFNYEIEQQQHKIDELKANRDYFLANFGKFFEEEMNGVQS